jgi:hypothetical protein
MTILNLEDQEIHEIMETLANIWSWTKANPLLVKISNQIKEQQDGLRLHSVSGTVGEDGTFKPNGPAKMHGAAPGERPAEIVSEPPQER